MSLGPNQSPGHRDQSARGQRKWTLWIGGFVVGVLVTALVVFLARQGGSGLALNPAADSSGNRNSGGDGGNKGADPAGAEPVRQPDWPKANLPALDLTAANRRAPIAGLPDWSKAGYRGGAPLPGDRELTTDDTCRITAAELASEFSVRQNDGADDSEGLQKAIDHIKAECSAGSSYEKISLIELPAGVLDVSRQLSVDADYLIIRGAGAKPSGGTRIVFRPDENTRYDSLTKDGGDWDEDEMESGDANGGWIWPGRGLFRVQSREVDKDYKEDYEKAQANRKDLFEGTVNVHWKAGVEFADKADGFAAKKGDTVLPLKENWAVNRFKVGDYVNIRAANTMKFYEEQRALPTKHELKNQHMRQQIFQVTAVDTAAGTITIDKPLEFDVPVDSTSDGSDEIGKKTYESRASKLIDPVLGVGFENFAITEAVNGVKASDARHNYGNLAPAEEMHGIVFKWAVNSWVRGIATTMTGSHPIVTEEAKNLQIQDNYLDGSWNKGKGGNGYLRGSRVWDSLYARNIMRNLRHFTFQWSASGNVVIGNDFDSDLNLHGGWERHNVFENNTVKVPFEHAPGNCKSNCGGEGGDVEDKSMWYPIWWGSGQKAVKWSGASGPQNVFFNNQLSKQTKAGGSFEPYLADQHTIYQFGWDGSGYQHLEKDGKPIEDWAGNETTDFPGNGIDTSKSDDAISLFLKAIG